MTGEGACHKAFSASGCMLATLARVFCLAMAELLCASDRCGGLRIASRYRTLMRSVDTSRETVCKNREDCPWKSIWGRTVVLG